MIECYFAFELFLIGVTLSLVIFAVELVSYTYLKKRNKIKIVVQMPTN